MSDSVRSHRWQPTRLLCPWDSPGKNTGVGCYFLLQCMKVKSESIYMYTYINISHVLAIVNSAAVNIGIHVFFSIMVSSSICSVMELLGHMLVLFHVSKGISILFSLVMVSVFIPANSASGYSFIHTLSSIYCS